MLPFLKKKDKSQEELKDEKGYNPYLISEIQPMGNIKFEERFVRKGDGYETCIFVHGYQSVVHDFWLEPIMNKEGVLPTLDISSTDRLEVTKSIGRSMSEQNNRYQNAKNSIDRTDAENSYEELKESYRKITKGEVIKNVILRLFVYDKTFSGLEVKTKEILDYLESFNFRGTVLLNEQQYEWESLVTSYNTQMKNPNKRKGKEIPSETLAGGNFLHYTSLNDPNGSYYGLTDTDGSVLFDLFYKDMYRKFYNGLVIGKMGAGKSTLLKKLMKDNAIKGHKVRILDVTGEFAGLTKSLGGKTISLDGTEGLINTLQVFKTMTLPDGTVDERGSFTQHISKMGIFYNFLNPSCDDNEIKEFKIMVRKLYIEKNLWSDEKDKNLNITNYSSDKYPIFSDLLITLKNELYSDVENNVIDEKISHHRAKRLENIILTIEDLVQNYGDIFDGTSSIDDFEDELVISISLRNLTNLEPVIFQAQIFNIMNMLWDGMIINGEHQLKSFTKGEMLFEDAQRYLIVLDEAYRIINTENVSQPAVKYLTEFMREARKYFGGIVFASHLITDFVPASLNLNNAENVKKLFQLTQYKFIGEQDVEAVPQIRSVFEGQLTESEVDTIPTLTTGKMILSISSVKNIIFKVDVSDEELELFGGGA